MDVQDFRLQRKLLTEFRIVLQKLLKSVYYYCEWRGGRVDDGTALEMRQVMSLGGSNPLPSAILLNFAFKLS